ncbi:MAG: amidohydrolase family protein [Candidatus Omnitrophota bacterium]
MRKGFYYYGRSVLLLGLLIGYPRNVLAEGKKGEGRAESTSIRYVETHVHLTANSDAGFNAATEAALNSMDSLGIRKCLLMPQPFTSDNPNLYDYQVLAEIVKKNPARFAFLGGGGLLNPMIYKSAKAGRVTEAMRKEFRGKAEEIVKAGAVGFGEFAMEHFSFFQNHPYLSVSPDHPLFRLLSDIAAEHNLPIDIHMEAVPRDDFSFPQDQFTKRSDKNPEFLKENIKLLERLLAYNRKVRIVWAHAGWDHTGAMTVELIRRLLAKHPNLYFSLKDHSHSFSRNRILDSTGKLKPEWKKIIGDFPGRFLLGSDMFYCDPKLPQQFPDSTRGSRLILSQLSPEVARKVAYENAESLYGIKVEKPGF